MKPIDADHFLEMLDVYGDQIKNIFKDTPGENVACTIFQGVKSLLDMEPVLQTPMDYMGDGR
jgi:hypothetical protein